MYELVKPCHHRSVGFHCVSYCSYCGKHNRRLRSWRQIQETKDNIIKTKENLSKVAINSHIEQSGRGYHLWIFFAEPIARQKIEVLIKRFIYHSAQIYAGKTKIRIPLGSYQKDKTIFCGFLDNSFNLVQDQEQYLMNIKPTSINTLQTCEKIVQR